MIAPLTLPHEADRLRSLQRLGLLNTEAEERFDRLTRIAASLFDVPIVTITLVDENRQWFKSCVGLNNREGPRDISFCGHTILSNRPLIISDALEDLRFHDNPLVTGAPNIRFYAGVPLMTDDSMLVGTICVIDRKPRNLSEAQVKLLQDMAALATAELNSLGHQQLLHELRRTQADFSAVFDSAAIGMALVSLDGRFMRTNQELNQLLGWSSGELEDRSFRDFIHADDLELPIEPVQQLLDGTNRTFNLERRCVHKSGSTVWIDVSVSLLRDAEGEPRCFISQVRDITERKATEGELLWKTAFLEANVNASNAGIVVVDPQGKKILQNELMAELWKIPPEIASDVDDGPQFAWCQNAAKTPITLEELHELQAHPENVLHREIELQDGRFLEVYSSMVLGRDGINYGRIFSFTDITERKISEGELARLHNEYERILNSLGDGVHWLGLDGRIRFENPAGARMLGYAVDELIGQPAHITMHHTRVDGTNFPAEECSIYRTLRDGVVRQVTDEVFWRKDGTSFQVEYTVTPTLLKGQPNGVVVTFTDVTQRRSVEREMNSARLAAESASQAKTNFLANMSHEIRTPLNGIIGMTELIGGTELTPEQKDYLETIHASSENLLTIVNDVLDFSKIEFGKLELDYHAFSLLDLIDDVVGLLNFRVAKKKLEFLFNIEEGLPVDYLGDVTRIRQVLVNLVTNAIKFTERGAINVEVVSAPAEAADQSGTRRLLFRVRDTGIGIPEDRLDRLFKVFSQVDASTTRRYGGSGLGLAICQKLVEIMGGVIRVESKPGAGSTFSFDLPLELARAQHPSESGSPLFAGRHLLIVDDNQNNRRMLSLQVARWKITWKEAAHARDALDILRSDEHFDAALLDLQMPETDGIMLARQIRQLPGRAKFPLILISSQTGDVSVEEIKKAGFAAVMAKPIRQNSLRSTLLEVLSENASPSTAQASEAKEASDRGGLTILVAEDNITNQKVAQQILRRLGFESDLASNGREAVTAVQSKPYDLVFMDVHMPEMDGLEATREIRSNPATKGRPLILALTADVLKGEREVCLEAGMDDYITKPIKIEALKLILDKLASSKAVGPSS